MKRKFLLFLLASLSIGISANEQYTKDDLYTMMLVNSPSIKENRLKVKAAFDTYKSYEGYLYPRVDYSFAANYFANPLAPINISMAQLAMPTLSQGPAIQNSVPNSADTQSFINIYPGMENMSYSASVSMMQPLNVFGKILNVVDISKEYYRATKYTTNMQRTKDKYLLFCSCDMISCIESMEIDLAVANDAADELIKLSNSSYENGMITYSKNIEAATSAYKIKSAYQNIVSQKENNFENIKTLTGNYGLKEEEIKHYEIDLPKYLAILDVPKVELVAKATGENKDIMRLRRSAERVAKSKKKLATGSMPYSPDSYLYTSLSYTTPRLPFIETDWYGKGRWQAAIGITLSGTAFDGFAQFKRKESAVHSVDSEKQNTRVTVRSIEDNITRLLNCIKVSAAEINYKGAQKREKELNFIEAGTKFAEGSNSKIDYLTAQIEKTVSNVELNNEYIKLISYYYTLMALVEDS